MTIYMCVPAIRVLTALLCATAACCNVALAVFYMNVREHWRVVSRLMLAVAMGGAFTLFARVQFSLWEGFAPPIETGTTTAVILLAAVVSTGVKVALRDGIRYSAVSLMFLAASAFTLPLFKTECPAFLAAAAIANADAVLSALQCGRVGHRRPMPYVLAQIVYALPVGIALYGRNGRLLDENEAFENFVAELKKNGETPDALLRRDMRYQFGGETYETSTERLPNRRRIVSVRNVTNHERAIAAEQNRIEAVEHKRLMTLALAEQDRRIVTLRRRERVIARLHDTVGQTLAVVNLSLELCAGNWERPENESAKDAYLSAAKTALKQYLGGKEAGQPALEESIHMLRDVYAALDVEIVEQGEPPHLSLREEIAITAICNEAVANAVRHGASKRVQMKWRPETEVLLRIENDAPQTGVVSESLGIRGMRERADEIGCVLSAEIKDGRFMLSIRREAPESSPAERRSATKRQEQSENEGGKNE